MKIKSNSLNLISLNEFINIKRKIDLNIKNNNQEEDIPENEGMINLKNTLKRNYNLQLGTKNGILDSVISDYAGQSLNKYNYGKVSGIIYDKIYPYGQFSDIKIENEYKYIRISVKDILDNLEYATIQLNNLIDQFESNYVKLEIDITGVNLEDEIELTEDDYEEILDKQLYNIKTGNLEELPTFIPDNEIILEKRIKKETILDWSSYFISKILEKDNIKALNITSSILNNLIGDNKYYKTSLKLQNLEEISIYWDLDLEDINILKLKKYNLYLKRLTIIEEINNLDKNQNICDFINSFNCINILSINNKYKNSIKLNNLNIAYYDTTLEDIKNKGWIVLDNMYNIYFEDDYIIEFQNRNNSEIRMNILVNSYKDIIIVNGSLKANTALKILSYGNVNIYYIKHVKDLSFII